MALDASGIADGSGALVAVGRIRLLVTGCNDNDELLSRFYIRVNAMDVPGVIAKVTTLLGDAGISLSDVIQHEVAIGDFVPLAITTHDAKQGNLVDALEKIEQLDVIKGKPVCIRIVNMPKG